MSGIKIPLEDRFWSRVKKTDSCWLWTGCLVGGGYGSIVSKGHHGLPLMAHRLSWELHYGPIPVGLFALHKCDNPSCVNPNHLFLGTLKDNAADRGLKGRSAHNRGERAGGAKLTELQVREIKALLAEKVSHQKISDIYGMSRTLITLISLGRRWAHLA